jgi:ComF family protein
VPPAPPRFPRLRFATLLDLLFELLAPSRCAACGENPPVARTFCAACGAPTAPAPAELEGVPLVVAGPYEPPLSLAIGRLKFEGHSELAPPLASLLAPAARGLALAGASLCVPVPLHPKRLVERGYDQAALLARALARAARLPCAPRLLARVRATEQQARLGREERADNVRGAFRVVSHLSAARVVLVDDVVTTGRTVSACVAALRDSGHEIAGVLALARAGG